MGRALVHYFRQKDYRITVFSRNPEGHPFHSIPDVEVLLFDHSIHHELESKNVVINLAGANIARRWTTKWKKKIIDSRVDTTIAVVEALKKVKEQPDIFIQASATGYYPTSGEMVHTEKSVPGKSFLSEVVVNWEKPLDGLNKDQRTAVIRTGAVVSGDGGMLPKILLPMRMWMGGFPGKGENWISWIHIDDFVQGVEFIINKNNLNGKFNFTSPHPVRMKDLVKRAASIAKRPAWFRIPPLLIKLVLGEMGREMILGSQKVIPEKLLKQGYKFKFPQINDALKKELTG